MPTASLVNRELACDICQEVVSIATVDLLSKTTDDQITNALDNSYTEFAQSGRAKCDTFVEEYESDLVFILKEERDPGLACAQLAVC